MEAFLQNQPQASFLQSMHAAEVEQAAYGNPSRFLMMYDDEQNTLMGVCLLHAVEAKRGKYLYAPYGPVFQDNVFSEALFDEFHAYITNYAKQEGFWFIRLAPYWLDTPELQAALKSYGAKVTPIHVLSEVVWKLDLDKDEDGLLMGMRKTTRNLIRRGIKDGVEVTMDTSEASIEAFTKLMHITEKRHQFVAYPDSMYKAQVDAFKDADHVQVFTASYQGEVIASAIVMFYADSASYHHGASIPSKIPAAYLLHWNVIQEAKRRGLKEYSFWGIQETEDKNHPFYGITRFKKGFGGNIRHLVKAHDIPISWKYWITYTIETIRRIKRGFGLKR